MSKTEVRCPNCRTTRIEELKSSWVTENKKYGCKNCRTIFIEED